ncbi:MAG: citrate lyase acyl carrier protein [Spirochaetaceae bacterium]|jgi:citrate lyase subunit gamma (acyl carrier protein)|nr:citrate lyase acyl carrier protein [Spirochaetaceae bacterium]
MEIIQTSVAGTLESSDIMITVEPAPSGIQIEPEIQIELKSVVEKQFGKDILRVVRQTLSDLQVKAAKVTVVDKGALDCTIEARLKTAVYRAAGSGNYIWNT